MIEDDFYNLFKDVSDLKEQITIINTDSYNNSIGLHQCNDVTYNLDERLSNLEQKIDEIYSILFNAKRLNLSDLDN